MTEPADRVRIFVDADACPVKDEIYRVSERLSVPVAIVTNSFIRVPASPLIERIAVPAGPDAADDWIAERADACSVVVTNDIPLADRCVKAGALVLTPSGKSLDKDTIGMAVAVRNLMTDLRSAGDITSGPSAFSARDRSAFLSALDQALRRARKRSG